MDPTPLAIGVAAFISKLQLPTGMAAIGGAVAVDRDLEGLSRSGGQPRSTERRANQDPTKIQGARALGRRRNSMDSMIPHAEWTIVDGSSCLMDIVVRL